MRFRVRLSALARRDLDDIYDFIATRAGDPEPAGRYVGRLRAACARLDLFPERGTVRSDLGEGVRVVGFERRLSIVFRVRSPDVEILRLLYGGRDLRRAFDEFARDDRIEP